jgi:hypothetical protein
MTTQEHRQLSLPAWFANPLAAILRRARTCLYQTPDHLQSRPQHQYHPDRDAHPPHRARIIPFPAPSSAQPASASIPFLVTRKPISPPNVPSLVQIL